MNLKSVFLTAELFLSQFCVENESLMADCKGLLASINVERKGFISCEEVGAIDRFIWSLNEPLQASLFQFMDLFFVRLAICPLSLDQVVIEKLHHFSLEELPLIGKKIAMIHSERQDALFCEIKEGVLMVGGDPFESRVKLEHYEEDLEILYCYALEEAKKQRLTISLQS